MSSGGGRGLAGALTPARKIFSSPFLETKSQKENPPCNVI